LFVIPSCWLFTKSEVVNPPFVCSADKLKCNTCAQCCVDNFNTTECNLCVEWRCGPGPPTNPPTQPPIHPTSPPTPPPTPPPTHPNHPLITPPWNYTLKNSVQLCFPYALLSKPNTTYRRLVWVAEPEGDSPPNGW
jgi:hypothetical protein